MASELPRTGEHLFWISGDSAHSAHRVRKDGSTAPELLVADGVSDIAVDTDHLYWLNSAEESLRSSLTIDCVNTMQTLATGLEGAYNLRVQGEKLYWLAVGFHWLQSCSIQGCPEGPSRILPDSTVQAYDTDEESIYAAVTISADALPQSRIRVFPPGVTGFCVRGAGPQ